MTVGLWVTELFTALYFLCTLRKHPVAAPATAICRPPIMKHLNFHVSTLERVGNISPLLLKVYIRKTCRGLGVVVWVWLWQCHGMECEWRGALCAEMKCTLLCELGLCGLMWMWQYISFINTGKDVHVTLGIIVNLTQKFNSNNCFKLQVQAENVLLSSTQVLPV